MKFCQFLRKTIDFAFSMLVMFIGKRRKLLTYRTSSLTLWKVYW